MAKEKFTPKSFEEVFGEKEAVQSEAAAQSGAEGRATHQERLRSQRGGKDVTSELEASAKGEAGDDDFEEK
ncbi:MAG: hypothetical protein AAB897_00160 [Patescibacteria group bacterium]